MDETWAEVFCHNVTWLRQYHRLSKETTALLLHIRVDWLEEIEDGRIPADLGVEVLFYIFQHFGIPLETQLGRKLGELSLY